MSSALMRTIGRAARQARRARKLTQEDVADRVGVSTQFYGRIERGYALPSVTTLRRMLEVLDLRADELLGAIELDDGGGANDAGAAPSEDMDSPPVRRLMRFLRRASPVTIEVVEMLLDEIDRAGAILRGQGRAGGAAAARGEAGRVPSGDGEDDEEDEADEEDQA